MVSNKSRLLRLYRYLYVNTDERHYTTKAEIMEAIREDGMTCTRQTVRDDIDTLTREGYDIETVVSSGNYYYFRDREFTVDELKTLGDVVLASPLLGKREKAGLIRKLKGLCSKYQAGMVERPVVCLDPCADRRIRRIISMTGDAVGLGRKMGFLLTKQPPEKGSERVPGQPPEKGSDGSRKPVRILCTPLGVILKGDRCYVAAIPEASDEPVLYDAADLTEAMITGEAAKEPPDGFDLETFAGQVQKRAKEEE